MLSVCSLQRDLSHALRLDDVDASSSVLLPFYDHDTHVLYLAGKVRQLSDHLLKERSQVK